MKISKKFYKNIPVEKSDIVEKKLADFAEIITNIKSLSEIPKGYWVRRIKGTEKYKFRVNSGDRIVFQYDQEGEINFLSFETHDTQIRSAHSKNIYNFEDFTIDKDKYVEDKLDDYVDFNAKYELNEILNKIKRNDVFDKEEITLAIEDPDFDIVNFLTYEQFEILNKHEELSVVLGCAGSGKTSIGITKLLVNQELSRDTLHITHSRYLKNEIEKDFLRISKKRDRIRFYSLQDYYEYILEQNFVVVYFSEFIDWITQNGYQNTKFQISSLNIYLEINTILKGKISKEQMLNKKEYLNSESTFNHNEKMHIYFIAAQYNKWLDDNKYYDLNDLARKSLRVKRKNVDIVLDEVQNFTEVQLYSILRLKKENCNIFLLGDNFQTIQNYNFSLERLKKVIMKFGYHYQISFLSNNFRSGTETVELLNKIKKEKNIYHHSTVLLEEKSIRKDEKPTITFTDKNFKRLSKNLNLNANAIIVASNEKDKNYLENEGFNRVFNIYDLAGLQYTEVYCYNLFNSFNTTYTELHTENKIPEINSVLFNFVYLASSRSIDKLVFIEDNYSKLSKVFDDYLMKKSLTEIISIEPRISTIDEWNKEGYYLKRMGQYEQAIDSFEKAKNLDEIHRCTRLIERKLNYEQFEKYKIIIKFNWTVNSQEEIENALIYLRDNLGWEIKGNITQYITTYFATEEHLKDIFIHEDEKIYDLAASIAQNANHGAARKDNIFINSCVYQEGIPIKVNTSDDNQKEDIYINFHEGKYSIQSVNAISEKKIINHFDKIYGKIQQRSSSFSKYNIFAHLENNNYEKSAKDHLDDIFG